MTDPSLEVRASHVNSERTIPGNSVSPRKSPIWRWNVGLVIFLMMIIPSSIMVVLYYREVMATYYVSRNPLPKSARDMAIEVSRIMVNDIRNAMLLGKALSSPDVLGSPSGIRNELAKYVVSGGLEHFAGWAVFDLKGRRIGSYDFRSLAPYVHETRSLLGRIREHGGPALFSAPIYNLKNRMAILLLAVPILKKNQNSDDPPMGYLVGIENVSGTIHPFLFRPKKQGAPGLSYVASSGGHILASSNALLIGQEMGAIGLGGVLQHFQEGQSGGFKSSVRGDRYLFGSALMSDLQGLSSHSWFVVLQAPEDVVMAKARRMRLVMDLVAFVVAPILFAVDCFFLFRSLRSSS
ncbi:MAG: hypothetical protein ACYCTV_04180 [Leptospirales bacterium]